MRELKEKWLNDFIGLGSPVEHNGKMIRPETRTSIAIGKISKLDEAGKNNLKLTLEVAGAKYDFIGFMNDNTPVSKLAKQAKEENLTICVRFEKKRKKGVDPSKSIDEITKDSFTARDNIVNIVAGVYNFNSEDWVLTDDAISNPDEDPKFVADELKKAVYSTDGFFTSPSKSNSGNQTFQPVDTNWKRNHLITMFTYASEHNHEHKLELDYNALKVLANYMLKATDQLQTRANNLPEPNYNDYSHTKARAMLFSWMKINPLTKTIMTTKGGFNDWITKFLNESVAIWEWATQEVGEGN